MDTSIDYIQFIPAEATLMAEPKITEPQCFFLEAMAKTATRGMPAIDTSASLQFLKTFITQQHMSVLAHCTFYFKVSDVFVKELNSLYAEQMRYAWYTKIGEDQYVLSLNYRTVKEITWLMSARNSHSTHIEYLCGACDHAVAGGLLSAQNECVNEKCEMITSKDITAMRDDDLITQDDHDHLIRRTVFFRTNRGISHQLVRHTSMQITQESSRYVRYGGTFPFRFVLPYGMKSSDEEAFARELDGAIYQIPELAEKLNSMEAHPAIKMIVASALDSVDMYKSILASGERPEIAREVLPNSFATSLYMTGSLKDWKHLLHLRQSSITPHGPTYKPHSGAKVLADQLMPQFTKEYPHHGYSTQNLIFSPYLPAKVE